MAKEIERKFLVTGRGYREKAEVLLIRQGYLSTDPDRVVRVRTAGDQGFITVKGKTVGTSRSEYEYDIPVKDGHEMLSTLCIYPLIEKHRFKVDYEGFTWEVDEFLGENEGLVVAEIELQDEHTHFARPIWLGQEVTDDPRYFNSNLLKHPYKLWK